MKSKQLYIIIALIIIAIALFSFINDQSNQDQIENRQPIFTTEDIVEFIDEGVEQESQSEIPESQTNSIHQSQPASMSTVSWSDTLETDAPIEWNFTGARSYDQNLVQEAYQEIDRLETSTSSDKYSILLSIGNQYYYIGDGLNALHYYQKALEVDTGKTGLIWFNTGNLMNKMQAFNSARYAYEKAYEINPNSQYKRVLDLLIEDRFSN